MTIRSTDVDDNVRISISATPTHDFAYLSIEASFARVQATVCVTREQLAAHRDACTAVLVASEALA